MFQTLCTLFFPLLMPTHAPPRRCMGACNLLSLLAAPQKSSAHCHRPSALTSLGTENTEDTGLGLLHPDTHWACSQKLDPFVVLRPRFALPSSCKPRKIKVPLFCKSSSPGEPNAKFSSRNFGITNYFQVVASYDQTKKIWKPIDEFKSQ